MLNISLGIIGMTIDTPYYVGVAIDIKDLQLGKRGTTVILETIPVATADGDNSFTLTRVPTIIE